MTSIIRNFKYIEAIITEGTFSKAADKLYVSQPYLSSFIKNIETEWNITIFNRKKRPLTFTAEGQVYYKYLQDQAYLLQDVTRKITNISNLNAGFLNIGVTPTLAFHILHKILPKFIELYPNIKIDLIEGDSQDIERQLLQGTVDVCLNTLPLWNKGINHNEIYTEPIYLVVPPQHYLFNRLQQKDMELKELMSLIANDQFIILKDRYGLKQTINKILDFYDMHPNIILETSNVDNAHRLAISTGVLTFIPSSSTEHNSNAFYIKLSKNFMNTVIIGYKHFDDLSKAGQNFVSLTLDQFNK
ncbi:LysR family transcriptional regulator [Staphylococcus sp. GSSP0090]|nr:LysR family transcriptional regulator [Staphylococcus sp. GSSP0090]